VLFEVVAALAVVFLLMLPIARRAASDLAGLMVLSAQTWSELPPETRPAFERELAISHQLELETAQPVGATPEAWKSPYLQELEAELQWRVGGTVELETTVRDGEHWTWAGLIAGGRTLWVGFAHSRVGPQPVAASLLTLGAGLVLALIGAWWLAGRILAPLRRFDVAADALGRGETPALLPETGPRELAALARRFNTLARQVQELLEARTTLLVGLSHDLRTPLARMRLALEMLERRPDPAWMDRLNADIGEMDRLVGDLLELARGLGREAPAQVDLAELLEALAERASETGAPVSVTCPSVQVRVPPAALRRVLDNLVANAQRYAPGQPMEIRVEVLEGGCRIAVLDRGPGIPGDQLEAVFRPFERVESSRSQVTGGSGLGLAIVRQLAQANGWRVWLENRAQGGLAAWVSLPLDR